MLTLTHRNVEITKEGYNNNYRFQGINKIETSDSIEDTQSIGNVDQMYDKFIRRIDSFRSIASSPNLGINTYRSGPLS